MKQPFGATNAPNTCKWCGRDLPRPTKAIRGEIPYPDTSPCCHAPLEECVRGSLSPFQNMRGTKYMICARCHGYLGESPNIGVIRREPRYAKSGQYGDGKFCGMGCGYQFALAIAELGHGLGVEFVERRGGTVAK